jgi:hypothetical protein
MTTVWQQTASAAKPAGTGWGHLCKAGVRDKLRDYPAAQAGTLTDTCLWSFPLGYAADLLKRP